MKIIFVMTVLILLSPIIMAEQLELLWEKGLGKNEGVLGRLANRHAIAGADQPLLDNLPALDDADAQDFVGWLSLSGHGRPFPSRREFQLTAHALLGGADSEPRALSSQRAHPFIIAGFTCLA